MKKRIFALLMVSIMLMGLLCACGSSSKVLTSEEAQKIALEQAGLTADQVTEVHTHVVTENGVPCYSVHITTADGDFSVVINAGTGEVIG